MPDRTVDLTGRTAVVTGCSSGLGRRFAVALAEHGADVVDAEIGFSGRGGADDGDDAGGGGC
ncbi:3-oxoacyl-ACP reductase, partial [Streptomyces carpinensis]